MSIKVIRHPFRQTKLPFTKRTRQQARKVPYEMQLLGRSSGESHITVKDGLIPTRIPPISTHRTLLNVMHRRLIPGRREMHQEMLLQLVQRVRQLITPRHGPEGAEQHGILGRRRGRWRWRCCCSGLLVGLQVLAEVVEGGEFPPARRNGAGDEGAAGEVQSGASFGVQPGGVDPRAAEDGVECAVVAPDAGAHGEHVLGGGCAVGAVALDTAFVFATLVLAEDSNVARLVVSYVDDVDVHALRLSRVNLRGFLLSL